ncbi:undecaprenyl-diphosphatase [Halocatena halophila]|uniref:undecaprenyl-diphosphatase n=1 Tax=Halocatena halophila TaxID=2814576 RepID=UPI002ED3616E
MIDIPGSIALFAGVDGPPLLNELMIVAAEKLIFLIPVTLVFLWFCGESDASPIAKQKARIPGLPVSEGKSSSVFVFVTILASLGGSYALGALYSHPAPYMVGHETLLVDAPENSFPSQHATVAFGFALGILAFRDRATGILLLVFATLVGVARWYVGVHYPIDIAGGFGAALIGVTVVATAAPAVNRFTTLCTTIETRILQLLVGG